MTRSKLQLDFYREHLNWLVVSRHLSCIDVYGNEQEETRNEPAETTDPTRLLPTTQEILLLCPRQVAITIFIPHHVTSSFLQVPNFGYREGVDTIFTSIL
jgi:hypothetical protein